MFVQQLYALRTAYAQKAAYGHRLVVIYVVITGIAVAQPAYAHTAGTVYYAPIAQIQCHMVDLPRLPKNIRSPGAASLSEATGLPASACI